MIDPLRNFFDIGDGNVSENDNLGMLSFFFCNRVELFEKQIESKGRNNFSTPYSKDNKISFEEDVFQALAGAKRIAWLLYSGVMIYRPK